MAFVDFSFAWGLSCTSIKQGYTLGLVSLPNSLLACGIPNGIRNFGKSVGQFTEHLSFYSLTKRFSVSRWLRYIWKFACVTRIEFGGQIACVLLNIILSFSYCHCPGLAEFAFHVSSTASLLLANQVLQISKIPYRCLEYFVSVGEVCACHIFLHRLHWFILNIESSPEGIFNISWFVARHDKNLCYAANNRCE